MRLAPGPPAQHHRGGPGGQQPPGVRLTPLAGAVNGPAAAGQMGSTKRPANHESATLPSSRARRTFTTAMAIITRRRDITAYFRQPARRAFHLTILGPSNSPRIPSGTGTPVLLHTDQLAPDSADRMSCRPGGPSWSEPLKITPNSGSSTSPPASPDPHVSYGSGSTRPGGGQPRSPWASTDSASYSPDHPRPRRTTRGTRRPAARQRQSASPSCPQPVQPTLRSTRPPRPLPSGTHVEEAG